MLSLSFFRSKYVLSVVCVIAFFLVANSAPILDQALAADGVLPPQPVVAIHVSELTQALENMSASPSTPSGLGTTGYEWWPDAWHYFVGHESVKEALSSDGTPFVEVTDSDISSGLLLQSDGSPRYPILISLMSEAIDNAEVGALRNYVSAGGVLFVGSSSFTRYPDGKSRGNFALANEMGLQMASTSLENWKINKTFTKSSDGPIVAHIPSGTLKWAMPLTSDDISWGIDPAHTAIGDHYVWNVNNINAEIIAQGSNGPLLTTKKYGEGYFLYYGAMQPLIGFGGHHCGMYAYGIFRNAIEWSFKQANLPILKLSPWQYSYDSAFMIRHDFENELKLIQSIEASAQIEHSLGVKGDYYFCTGALRESSYDITTTVNSLRRAISDYGATIGSHNGGLPNPVNPNLARDSYDYWHWGPDEALDYTPSGYNTGKEYAIDSIERSFGDIENWFKGLDNGRPDCNLLGNCPRTWVSPWFNATREDSYDILEEIGVVSVGEQKLTPFPHWTVSTETPGKYYSILSLPVSDWYVGSEISQSLEWSPHTVTTIHELVDHYYGLGALINLYNHSPSTAALVQEYILYAKTKPRLWVTNSTGVYDWWQLRSQATVMPTYYEVDGTSNAVAEISGVKDPDTSIEIVIPNWSEIQNHSVQVFVNGSTASPSDFRTTDYGVKCRLASGNSHIEVQYVGPSAITNLEVFPDSFENGLGNWKQDSQNDWYLSTQRATAGSYSAEVDGSASNAQLVSIPIDLQGSTSATVTFSWYIESSLDTGEYIAFDVSTDGGITWVEKARLRGNVDTEEVWHNVKVELTGIQSLILRFRGTMSDSTEDANIDSLSVTIPRTNTAPVATGDAYATNQNTLLSVAAPGVLSNDTDAEGSALTAVLVIGPAHGTLSLNANGSFSYTPTTGYVGSDSFSYMANDGKANSNTATVAITVNNILYSENFDSNTPNPLLPWTIVSGTWKTANGVVQGSSQPWTYATIYLNGQPVWDDYTVEARVRFPAGSYGGGIGGRVNPTTGARYGAWVYPSGSFGGSNVLNLVKFRDWTTWNFSAMQQVSLPNVGTGWHTLKMIFSGNEIKVYYDGTLLIDTVDNNFDSRGPYLSGGISLDSWTYTSSYVMEVDDVAASISELVPVNTAPVATGDAYATNQNTLLSVAAPGVLSNDTDAEGSALTAVLVSGPAHGTLSLNANGSFSYTPTTGYVGSDSFSYRANDGKANSNTATVAITVIAVNTAPVATGDAYATNQNTLLSVAAPGVLSNDTDAEGSALTAVLVSGPAHGTLSLNANGSFSYTPTTGYVGSDSFSYRANDGKANSNTATVAITVIAVNTAPVATGDAYATNQNTLLSVAAPGVLSNDTDAEGSALTAVLVSGPAHGTLSLNANGSFSYTPTTGYVGSDSFSYRANDGKANSNTATVAITVIAVNTAPVATGDAYATNQNTLLSVAAPGVLSNDTDAEGSALTAVLVSGPAHGTLSLNANGSFSYTPTTGYVGSDSFSYRANDGKANSNTATVAITVIAVNTAPVATGDAYATNQNTLLSVAAPGVLSNDTDAEGSALTAVLVSGPAHGTLSLNANGSFSYTPTTGYVGSDSFSYRANDGKANSNTATVAITVIAVNTAPVATGDAYATNQNTLLSVAAPGVLSNDTDAEGSALTAVLVSGPAHGTLSLNANGSFSYTPTTGYVGSDSFSYRANDGKANSNTATVAITVNTILYTENFNSNTPNPLLPWTVVSGTWKTANGVVQGSSQAWTYATIYLNGQAARDDYSVEARVRFPSGSYGGGIGGRVNPTTGARYGAWVYPSGSFGGSNVLKLVKFRDWTTWNFSAMQQVSLPNVGTGWHTLKMIFSGNEIKVYYDGTLLIDTVDNNFDSRVPYLSGGISVDSWTYTTSYVMEVDDLVLADIAVPNHEITLWKENKPGAVSLTFDDGFVSQYSVGVTALNEFGFKGTFFVITDFASTDPNFASWDNWRNAANEGHEIGSHSKTHSYLTSLSTAKIQEELFGSKTEIDNQIESQKCLTIAYPYGDYNNDVIGVVNDAGYIAGRSVEWGINSPPYDFASINAIFPDSAKANGVTMESQTDLAEQTGQWIVVGFHRLDGEDDPYAIPEYRFREYIEYLNTKDLWVDTFGSVTKYIRERDSASLSVVSSSSEAIVLNLTDGLDDTIYDEALTIKSAVPGTCISALVQQGTNVTTVDATSQGATKVIYYEAIPDRGNISITYFYYL